MVGDRGEDLIGRLLERCSFPVAGTAVTCGVSGGADSLSLLVLSVAAGCEVTAVHVDHGLRPDSANDALVVAEAARRFGAGFRSVRVEVGDGPNLEARARAARHEVLGDALLGHTADDQAETVLWFLARGTGPAHRRFQAVQAASDLDAGEGGAADREIDEGPARVRPVFH